MLGNFTYENPTRVHFGKEALDSLAEELRHYGPKVMLTYGGGSIKRNGIYDKVMKVLHDAGKTVIEEGGVMPNPDIEKYCDATFITTTGYYTLTREDVAGYSERACKHKRPFAGQRFIECCVA